MLKLFVSAAQLALPLCLLTAAIVANRSYRPTERRLVGRLTVGSVLAGALAAAVIVFLRLTTKHVRLPVINLWVGTLLALALALFLAALWVMGRLPLVSADSGGLRNRALTGASLLAVAVVGVSYGIPLYLAVDGVVPMGGTLFASDSLVNLIGYALGVAVAAAAGLAFGTGLGLVPGLARRVLATVPVGIALIGTVVTLYQQYASARLLPKSSLNFQVLLWLQRNNIAILLALVVALAVTYTVGKRIAEKVPELSPIEASVVNGDRVEVDLQLVSDGHLHRFAYDASGTGVRFIVIQKNPTAFGTGLDACEICGPSGYFERDGKVVCRECDVIMNTSTIGFPGGCNPIPIQYELTGGKLLFQVAELESQARVFA